MNRIIKVFSLSIVVFFFGCRNEKQPEIGKKEQFQFPLIVDTSMFDVSKRETTWLSTANYEVLYIGKRIDTIYPDYELKYFSTEAPLSHDTTGYHKKLAEHKMYPYYVDWTVRNNHKLWNEANVSITVDVTQKIKNDDIHVDWNQPFFEAYPVLIENKDKDTVKIGYGEFLPLIAEAKDSSGTWRPIERMFIYTCGNGVGSIILPPKEIVLSATMIYHGDYSTVLRLSVGKNHSNEFKGKINYGQFRNRLTVE